MRHQFQKQSFRQEKLSNEQSKKLIKARIEKFIINANEKDCNQGLTPDLKK